MASPPEEVGGEGVALPEEVLLLLRELDEADAAVARLVPSAEEVCVYRAPPTKGDGWC